MQKSTVIVLLFILLLQVLTVKASVPQDSIMMRMLGFQYPLDATANYALGWIERWDAHQIEYELQTIRSNFTHFNLLRIAIPWHEMGYEINESILLDHIQYLLDLGRKYDFKFLLYLMDRTGGTWPNLTPENYLETNWDYHEERISNVLERFKSDSQVYAWGLENEANVFQEVQVKWFQHFIPFMKAIDTDTPICTSFYPLGLNSTTISRYQEIASFGLDFIEYHHYAQDFENITARVDWFTSYIDMPIFISEFSVYGGLSTYNTTTNQRILKNQIKEWEKRPNVIGMSYYRFSNDTDPWTIWNQTTNSMKPEGNTLNTYGHAFLTTYPYGYACNLGSTNATRSIQIYDSSFENLTEWPNRNGWTTSRNHTMFDLKNITSTNPTTGSMTNKYISNFDFDQDFQDWNYWPQEGSPDQFQWKIVNPLFGYLGQKALKLWANTTRHNDTQAIHTAMPVTSGYSYFLQAYVKVESVNLGAYAFISINFRNSSGAWIEWSECEHVNTTCDWTQICVSAIAPLNAVDMVISLRTRAWDQVGQNITAYFDYLTLQETIPATLDGRSYAMAWGRGTYSPDWNHAEVIQNYTFLNPDEDVQRIWTFKCKMATVMSTEYWTDWKGCLLTLAFTTSNPDKWVSWYCSKYLSSNHQFTELEVSAIPPSNAKGLLMIIKISIANYGVMFFDDARLYNQPIVVPKNFTVSAIAESGYNLTITFATLKNTAFQGNLYSGNKQIISANCSFDALGNFWYGAFDTSNNLWSVISNKTTIPIEFQIGQLRLNPLIPILLIVGAVCSGLIIMIIISAVKRSKKE